MLNYQRVCSHKKKSIPGHGMPLVTTSDLFFISLYFIPGVALSLAQLHKWWKPWENVRTWGCVPLFNGCKNLDKNKDRMGNLGCTDFWMNRVECCGTQKKHHRPHLFGVCLSVKRCMGISDLCIYIYNVQCNVLLYLLVIPKRIEK